MPKWKSAIAYVTVRLDVLVRDDLNAEDAVQEAVSQADYQFTYHGEGIDIESHEIVGVEFKEVKS